MYLELDEGYPGHRKTLRLCALLKCDTADSYPPRLWAWAARSAPDGDLTGMDAAEIEMALRFRGKAGVLFAALVQAGFIDHEPGAKTVIHNWATRTGAAIARMDDRAARVRERRAHNQGRCLAVCSICAATVPDQIPAHPNQDKTSQDQARPDQTRPDQPATQDLRKEKSAATASPSAPPVMVFPCDGPVKEWALTGEQVAEWSSSFPALDILAICRTAHAWILATPAKRKTASGMPRFLVAWFTRDQNRGAGRPTPIITGKTAANVGTVADWGDKRESAG